MVLQHKIDGNLEPLKRGKPRFSHLTNADLDLKQLISEHPDATLAELCELFALKTGNWVSCTAMFRALQKLELSRKKKHSAVAKPGQKKFKN